jgi:hypothetical protein
MPRSGTMTLQATTKTILSLALFVLSYLFVGWGSVLGTWDGWVFALVAILGALLGIVVLLVCLQNLIIYENERWTSIAVLLTGTVGLIAYFAVRRRNRTHQNI